MIGLNRKKIPILFYMSGALLARSVINLVTSFIVEDFKFTYSSVSPAINGLIVITAIIIVYFLNKWKKYSWIDTQFSLIIILVVLAVT